MGIFQRAGELVKVIRHQEDQVPRILKIPEGSPKLKPFTVPMFTETVDRSARVMKWSKTEEEFVPVDCPKKIAENLLARGEWRLPHLAGLIAAPIIRFDGTLLRRSGYDEATRLYLQSDCEWPPIPTNPTWTQAKAALEILKAPFAEFPFVTEADRSVLICAILTALQRRLLGASPLFGFSAPQPRTGKSHLSEAPALLALGRVAPAFAISSEGEELRKALTAILREGHSIVNLDNLERPLRSAELCKILTQEKYGDRLLGENSTLDLPTNLLFTATGNNLVFRGDLAQRVLLCQIDANVEDPEQRDFKIPDIKAYLLAHRAELAAAALSIMLGFRAAGAPKQACKKWGGFEDWSAQIREPLIWAGAADPFTTREAVIHNDPEMENATAAMRELHRVFEKDAFSAREAVEKANDSLFEKSRAPMYADAGLHSALAAVAAAGKGQAVDLNRFSYWLRKWRDRFAGGWKLRRENPNEKDHNAVGKWKILGQGDAGDAGG